MKKLTKGITKALAKGNYTLSGKQKTMPGAKPAPKYKPIQKVDSNKKVIPKKGRSQLASRKSSRA